MVKLVVLLRGINVGGRNKVLMADLRLLLGELGYEDVKTIGQTGNIVLSTDRSAADTGETIATALSSEYAFAPKVMVRNKSQFMKAVEANPYPQAESKPTTLHVAFLSEKLPAGALKDFDLERYLPDTFEVKGREIYFHLPNGAGRTELLGALSEKRLGVDATLRNWNTVSKLAAHLDV